MTFSNQGIGAVFGSIVILLLLASFQQEAPDCAVASNNPAGYSEQKLENVWRITYAIGAVATIFLTMYRHRHLVESEAWQTNRDRAERKILEGKYVYDLSRTTHSYTVAFKFYWARLLSTAGYCV
jgi:MFS family permease